MIFEKIFLPVIDVVNLTISTIDLKQWNRSHPDNGSSAVTKFGDCYACYHYYLRRFSESRSSIGSTPSVRLSVRNTLGVPSLCNL